MAINQTVTNNTMSDKINSMYQAQQQAQQQALQKAKDDKIALLNQQKEQQLPKFHNQRVGVDTDSGLQQRRSAEMLASQGVRGGDNITANARLNTDRANQIQAIQNNENDYVRDIDNQIANANRDYSNGLAQYQAQADFEKANKLFGIEQDKYNWDRQTSREDMLWDRNNKYNESQKLDDRKYNEALNDKYWNRDTTREDLLWNRNNAYNEKQTISDRNWQKEFWQTQANWDKKLKDEDYQRQLALANAKSSYNSSYSGGSGGITSKNISSAIENDVLSSTRGGNLNDISASKSRVQSAYQQGYISDSDYRKYNELLDTSNDLNTKAEQKINQGTYGYSTASRTPTKTITKPSFSYSGGILKRNLY